MLQRIFVNFLVLVSGLMFSQTGKEIIDKNIELSGGLVGWKSLNSVLVQGKVSLGLKEEYPINIYQQRPNLTKTSIEINNKKTTIEGYDGKKGYAMNYAANKLQEYPNYKAESFDNDFIDFESKGFEANYLGKEVINGIYCHKVELIKNVNKTIYYFDTKNYMLLREIKKDEVLDYSDYKKVGGLQFAFRIEESSKKNEKAYVILINKIEINRVFPDYIFEFK